MVSKIVEITVDRAFIRQTKVVLVQIKCHYLLLQSQVLNHPGWFEEDGVKWNVLIANTPPLVVGDIGANQEIAPAVEVVEKNCK